MTDRRGELLTELENLQAQRRHALENYNRTNDRACMREVQDVSQVIADKLREMEEMDGMVKAVDALMGAEH